MKNKGYTLSLIAAGAVIIVAAYLLLKQPIGSTATVNKPSAIIDEARTEAIKIAASVDKKGYAKTTYERKADIIGNGDITKLPVSQSVIDSLRLDNLDKNKQLQQASLITATWQAKALRATKQVDSMKRETFHYSDSFADATFTPDSLGGLFDLKYKIKLIRHDYKSPKSLFKRQVNYTDILTPDPRITIDGMQTIGLKSPKPSRFAIGLQGGYYYDPLTKQFRPAIGVGLSYNLIHF